MNKALFLDRDGIINVHNGYVYQIEHFIFNEHIFDVCNFFQSKNYKIIVITNQAGIAKEIFKLDDFAILNEYMINEFLTNNIFIDHVYFCPHHPDYDLDCFFRKPNPGMILKARDEYKIDLESSIFIGDQNSDIEAASKAGIGKSFLFNLDIPHTDLPYNCDRITSLLDSIKNYE